MNPQEKVAKRRSSVLTEEPLKKKVAEGKLTEETKNREESSSDSDDEDYGLAIGGWDYIGEGEALYLASTRKELHDLIITRGIFEHKAKEKKMEKLIELSRSLLTYSRQNIEELQLAQPDEEKLGPEKRSKIGKYTTLVSFQHTRLTWLLDWIFLRAEAFRAETKRRGDVIATLKKEKDQSSENLEAFKAETERRGDIIATLKKEKAQLSENLGKMTRERDELLGRVNAQKKEAATRDVCVSTEPEIPEDVVMEENSAPLSLPQGVPANLVGALEAIIERKFGELFSRIGQPAEKDRVSRPDTTGTWAQVVGRKKKGSAPPLGSGTATRRRKVGQSPARVETRGELSTPQRATPNAAAKGKDGVGKRKAWPSLPKTAAVAVNPLPGGGGSGAEFIKEAQSKISLEELGIPPLEIKRSRMGGYILGVSGGDSEEKADLLASELSKLEGANRVAVSRPKKKLDIRVSGLETNASSQEVAEVVAAEGGCHINEVRQGEIRGARNGMDTLWLQCPAAAAIKLAKKGYVSIGWARATVALLKNRSPRCFGCLETGHLRWECPSVTDRSARCYRCGETGHKAQACRADAPNCPLCRDLEGRDRRHVLGGPGCYAPPPRRQNRAEGSARVTPSGVT